MLDRVHLVEVLETLLCLDGSEFRNVERSAGLEFEAQRVGSGNNSDHAREQVRPLGKRPSHGDATGRAAENKELVFRRVAARDEIFGAGDEVAPGVWLVRVLAGEAPRIPQFAAAAHMARGISAACFEETDRAEAEIGELRDAVGAVCLDEK